MARGAYGWRGTGELAGPAAAPLLPPPGAAEEQEGGTLLVVEDLRLSSMRSKGPGGVRVHAAEVGAGLRARGTGAAVARR